jgi:hypothetical protein
MRVTGKPRVAWVEGKVDRTADHVSVSYGESPRALALVGQHKRKGFTVQFLLKARPADARSSRILNEIRRELTFYLLDVVGPDSWPFVRYHCESPANRRSIVHWSWHPAPARAAGHDRHEKRAAARTVPA